MHSVGVRAEPQPVTTFTLGEVLHDDRGRRYLVHELLARGGMGEVYRGIDQGTGQVVAIKTVAAAVVGDPKIAARTRFEAGALTTLRHPNVVQVYSGGVHRGVFFMVMEYLEGITLAELQRSVGKVPIPWVIALGCHVCRGLSAIHQHAIHRDLTPSNLHFGVDGVLRILDLGAAKWPLLGRGLTSTGVQVGSILYLAPELLEKSAPVGAAADVWAIGVVLYELLTGQHPFSRDDDETQFAVGRRIIEEPHFRVRVLEPRCPGDLAGVVDRALQKQPGARQPSAAALLEGLEAARTAFARVHGPPPPLAELAAQLFPEARRESGVVEKGRGIEMSPARLRLQSTGPLDPSVRLPPPTALPYHPTQPMPAVPEPETGAPREAAPDRAAAPPPARGLVEPAPRVRRVSRGLVALLVVLLGGAAVGSLLWGLGGGAAPPEEVRSPRPKK